MGVIGSPLIYEWLDKQGREVKSHGHYQIQQQWVTWQSVHGTCLL